jgi:hypothetical protein
MVAIRDRTSGVNRERMMRPPLPEPAPALPMPAQHSLGPDKEEMASPAPQKVADEQPEELVSAAKAGPALAPEGDLKLLA